MRPPSADDAPDGAEAEGPGGAASRGHQASGAEQRRLELRIRAQNRALREKEQQLLGTVEQLQEKEEAAARLAYLAQEESRKLAAALQELGSAQQTLASSEQKFRAVADTAMDAVVSADSRGVIIYANRSAGLTFGYPLQDIEGEPLASLFPERWHERFQLALARTEAAASPLDRTMQMEGRRRDGDEFPIEISVSTWTTEEGRFFTALIRDITDRKRAEAALLEARQDLERRVEERTRELSAALDELREASRLKDEFLATLSHELRTPLNAILGWAAMLKSGSVDPPRAAKAAETIHRNAQAQSQLISDMLDMSRIVAGKLRLAVAPLDPPRVIEAALDTIRPAAEAKGIRLETILDPHAGPILADPDRLQQVLWNLLTNAVKFTPRGGKVVMSLRRVNSHVEMRVQDSGVGIPPDFLPHVFDRFRQADSSSTRRFGGLGLGLAIVRHLVELHGGTVHADSQGEGQGSVFVVKLPVMSVARRGGAHAEPAPLEPPPGEALADAPTLQGLRVLVVDDEVDARDLVSAVLASRGAEVETADSAGTGLSALKEWRPDVLLCDIEMPGGDGYSLIAAVRALSPREGGRVPAAALTAYARAEDRVRSLRAGFDLHFPKPIEPAELVVAVATLATRIHPRETGDPPRGG